MNNKEESSSGAIITELKETVSLLQERYRVLTENLAASVVIRESSGRILYCSPFTEVLTGYSVAEMIASERDFFPDIVHPEDRERYDRGMKISLLGEPFQFRYRLIHKSGIELWVETRTVPLPEEGNGEDSLSSSLAISFDITASMRYERQLEGRNRDLHDFTFMITHDIRGPLETMRGMVAMLEEEAPPSPVLTEGLSHMRKAAERLDALVTSMLEYSRIATLDEVMKLVDLDTLLHELKSERSALFREQGASLELRSKFPAVLGEKTRLYQVFSNLLDNALKFRSPARPLQVSIAAGTAGSGRQVEIIIADNGIGIPRDKIGALFRPFQRAHGNRHKGTGIGLASVKKLMDHLGGSVKVESEENQGCKFILQLQRA